MRCISARLFETIGAVVGVVAGFVVEKEVGGGGCVKTALHSAVPFCVSVACFFGYARRPALAVRMVEAIEWDIDVKRCP